jgi:gp16 family phage-associated protein
MLHFGTMMSDRILDTATARKLFEETGTSVSEWARVKGFSAVLVYQVLDGRRKCMRGQSHRIAVALGLKQGLIMGMDEVSKKLMLPTATTNANE